VTTRHEYPGTGGIAAAVPAVPAPIRIGRPGGSVGDTAPDSR
jgi:hypothetical protein